MLNATLMQCTMFLSFTSLERGFIAALSQNPNDKTAGKFYLKFGLSQQNFPRSILTQSILKSKVSSLAKFQCLCDTIFLILFGDP